MRKAFGISRSTFTNGKALPNRTPTSHIRAASQWRNPGVVDTSSDVHNPPTHPATD